VHDLVALGKALSDPARVRLLAACLHAADEGLADDLCVCQLIELVGLAPSTVSRHLSILRDAGLLASRREGKWIYYRTVSERDDPSSAVARTLDLVRDSLAADAALRDDARSVLTILQCDPEELCRSQRPGATTSDSSCCSSAPETPVGVRWRKGSPTPSSRT
jgi:ArsR family transcriptional regulator